MIIEWPLNGQYHERRDVNITSRMVVFRFPSNNDRYLKCRNFVILIKEIPSVIIMESDDLEMTVSENHDRKS